ncbi:glycosyltransferase family 2 protein [Christiangramia sp. OXR-203]|jgi:glycosyltransferase involved in cell wall biosynthesis|uniref:glycosyltransferase family 2 protein n=1 Tax=Christiangramia sp. OXR-203 TaxID=3100176 RepID=UPI002AC96558|nr:glycosyltransferase [Christiangramia sp. OXR-203]WPY97900.1 glycosyltransferase [Christiangramia sp. OXR-203]
MDCSILISTRNRISELKVTLSSIDKKIGEDVEILVCDDNSSDGTFNYLKNNFPKIRVFQNSKRMGYLFNRNLLMSKVRTKFAMSLDDDASLISEKPLKKCKEYFEKHPSCGVIAFRIFWGRSLPSNFNHSENSKRVKSFVGCGHIWRMDAWRGIPSYPEWFKFYGEENFASFQLLKKDWEIHYVPEILINHRVDNIKRQKDKDFYRRRSNALKADWFNILLFYPTKNAARLIFYSIVKQFEKAWIQRDSKVLISLFKSMIGILLNLDNILKERNQLTQKEFRKWKGLSNTQIYWSPNN